jgi:hypothetical protein
MQRLHYLHTTSYYVLASLQLLFLATPPMILFFGASVSNTDAVEPYAGAALPYFAALVAFLAVYGNSPRALGSALFAAPVYLLAAARAMVGMRPDSHPTEKSRQRWFSPLVIPQICAFGALTGTIAFATVRDRETPAFVVCWAAAMAFLLAGPLIAINASDTLESALRVAVRGALVLAALIVAGSQNWVWTRDGRTSTHQLQVARLDQSRRVSEPNLGQANIAPTMWTHITPRTTSTAIVPRPYGGRAVQVLAAACPRAGCRQRRPLGANVRSKRWVPPGGVLAMR